MATSSLIQALMNVPNAFGTFIDQNMVASTYVAEYKNEGVEVEYTAQKVYSEVIAEYLAAAVGSVVAANAAKPTHELPTAGELSGRITRMADEWQLSNDKLEQYYYLEGRYNARFAGVASEQAQAEAAKLAKFLFDPFEKAVIAPHKRLDLLYFEGLFNGTQTVSRSNNPKSSASFTYPIGAHTAGVKALWSDEKNADPLTDIENEVNRLASKGKTVRVIRMSKRTFRLMCAAEKFKAAFTQTGQKQRVQGNGIIGIDAVNEYFSTSLLPEIQIDKDRFITLADGSTTNMTIDNRVVFVTGDKLAVIKASDPLEVVDPQPNKVYAQYDGNLVGFWRDTNGRFIDYEMYGIPVFVGQNNFSILKTDSVSE
jgi:hypothetical protein